MKKLLKKLKNNSGETIGETLVALLIGSLALVMLAAAISSATGIIKRSSTKLNEYYGESNTKLVQMTSASSGKNVTITSSSGSGNVSATITVPVKYGEVSILGSSTPVIAFKKAN